jgi:hypothetical protein
MRLAPVSAIQSVVPSPAAKLGGHAVTLALAKRQPRESAQSTDGYVGRGVVICASRYAPSWRYVVL